MGHAAQHQKARKPTSAYHYATEGFAKQLAAHNQRGRKSTSMYHCAIESPASFFSLLRLMKPQLTVLDLA